jgi:hypothetical protein
LNYIYVGFEVLAAVTTESLVRCNAMQFGRNTVSIFRVEELAKQETSKKQKLVMLFVTYTRNLETSQSCGKIEDMMDILSVNKGGRFFNILGQFPIYRNLKLYMLKNDMCEVCTLPYLTSLANNIMA